MPSVSKRQHRLMEAVAHNPGFAKKVGIPQKVGKHFHEADMKGKKRFSEGGSASETDNDREMKAELAMAKIAHKTPSQPDPNNPTGHKGMIPYKKGGKVMKESKSMAKAEMKALKRGHAPKSVMEHEKKEHKEMGYKKGGHIKHAPKHHEKHMKRGGVSARMKKPAVPPAALAAMMGGAGAGAPPMGGDGAPMAGGMKHGGHVHVSHHHHYARGGHVKHHAKGGMTAMKGKEFTKDRKGTEKIIGGGSDKSKHGDGHVKKGHTKAKMVKMASGGHVGSHKHRRADGIAVKGHTSCKMR